MNRKSTCSIVVFLVALSAVLYGLQICIFHDMKDTAFYMLQDWAFLPIQSALVTVIVGRIMNEHEKEVRLEKTRILTSTYFSDLGAEILKIKTPAIANREEIAPAMQVQADWKQDDFKKAVNTIKHVPLKMANTADQFKAIKDLLEAKRMTLLVIASNPSLLEHEDFTDMLWAVFHLNDELMYRGQIDGLSETDLLHLNADAQRVLQETLINWMCHLEFLQKEYPYLYQLELVRNPLAGRKEIN